MGLPTEQTGLKNKVVVFKQSHTCALLCCAQGKKVHCYSASRAISRTSLTSFTQMNVSLDFTDFGISWRSFLFFSGMITVLMPALKAPNAFSLRPPMGSTRPLKEISPVMPTLLFTLLPVKADTRAVAMAIPAEGPSLGMAPAGTWI